MTATAAQPEWPAGPDQVDAPCLVCQAAGPHPLAVSIGNLAAATGTLRFLRCGSCGSLTATGSRLFEYTDGEAIGSGIWRHYLQVGAGIEAMVAPLDRARAGREGLSLLDVGCGFGYTLDYWRHVGGGAVVGLEPSEYGRMGRDLLGVDIRLAYLHEDDSVLARRFDIVFSSEVIEHVPDPQAFLRDLAGCLAPGGVLALTTPNAEFVRPDSPLNMVVGALSPGMHKLLFSATALESVIRAAGFPHVLVEVQSERLLAYASQSPLALEDAAAGLRARYIGYLLRRAAAPAGSADLMLGFRFRAMKELVNAGRVAEALPQADAYEALVREAYDFDPTDAAAVAARLDATRDLADHAGTMPFSLGCFLFYRAMAARQQGALPEAIRLFALAETVIRHSLGLEPVQFQEAATLLWRAAFERGFAALVAGEPGPALAALDAIPLRPEDAPGGHRFAALPPDLPPRIALLRANALLQSGQATSAEETLRAWLARPGALAPAQADEARHLLAMAASNRRIPGLRSLAARILARGRRMARRIGA